MSVNGVRVCILRTIPATVHIRDGMKLRAWQPTPVFSPGESHGQRSLAGYTPWGSTESDTSKVTEHACMKLRADPIAKELIISTDQAGGLEQEKQKSINLSPRTRLKRVLQNTREG